MAFFRIFLSVLLVILVAYTCSVVARHGIDLLPVFFGDIFTMAWPGQFNLDFLFMLILSAMWTAWRNGFSGTGLVLAFFALIGGSLFLTVYLLVLSCQTNGNVERILLGRAPTA